MSQKILRSPSAIQQKLTQLILQGEQGTATLKFYEDPETRSVWALFPDTVAGAPPTLLINIPGDTPLELAALLQSHPQLDELMAIAILFVSHFPRAFGQKYQNLILEKLTAREYTYTQPVVQRVRLWVHEDTLESMGLRQHMIQLLEPLITALPTEQNKPH